MNALRTKRSLNGIASVLLPILLMIVPGCGSSGPGNPVSTSDQYQQKVYLIGEIKDPSTSATGEIEAVRGPVDAVNCVFVNRVSYDGQAADAPIFLAAERVSSLTDTIKRGILATYRNGKPIILVRGDETQINALLGILGLEPNYKLPENFSYAELFVVSAETGGKFMWSLYPPGASQSDRGTSAYTDGSGAWLNRAGMFRDWMKKTGSRTQALTAFQKEAAKALAANGATEPSESNLIKLAQAYQHVKIFTDPLNGNTYQVIYNIYSCHSFNTADGKNYDWFYIEQEGDFDGSQGYGTGIRPATYSEIFAVPGAIYWGGQTVQEIVKYMGSYTMSNSMMVQGGDKLDQSVVLEGDSPETNNSKTTVKSGVTFNIGGDVGFRANAGTAQGGSAGGDVSGALRGGVTITNDRTVDVYDCTVELKAKSSGYTDDAKWVYTFTRPDQYGWMGFSARMNEPVKLSKGDFKPGNKWIWRFSPDVREGKKKYRDYFTSTLDAENITTISSMSVLWVPISSPYHGSNVSSFKDSVPLSYPPLIVAPGLNATFSAAGQVKYMDAHVSSDWSASSDQPWCQAAPATGKGNNTMVSVTVDRNTTGQERKATVTFATNDGKGKDTMTVIQSQY